MNQTDYTPEELEILDYVENQHPKSVRNIEIEKKRYTQIFTDNVSKRKQVSLRILERDLYQLRTKALIQGVPYQTLIGSVLHQYINGELVSKNS
ncbi:MAG: hypothetical protein V3V09_04560 [Arenicellales bacterium]